MSPDRSFAISIDILDRTGDGDAEVIDLRTGKAVSVAKNLPGIWNECGWRWESAAVVFPPCGERKQPLRLPLRVRPPTRSR